ncbi:MAG: M1 family peptidase, partial [Gelidibacter sp.]|nr:M1 family peptidase [Gelidibacter sp.]
MKRVLIACLLFISVFSNAQQTDYVDFKIGYVELDMRIEKLDSVRGVMEYTFDILKPIDSIFLDAKGVAFKNVFLNEDKIKFYNDGKKLWIINDFQVSTNNKLYFQFASNPKQALYKVDKENSYQVWTQGQGKYTSNWLPSIDDVNDKIIFGLSVASDKSYEVISNGVLEQYYSQENDNLWFFKTKHPMSSYLVALVIGKYNKKTETSESGIPLEYYYYP